MIYHYLNKWLGIKYNDPLTEFGMKYGQHKRKFRMSDLNILCNCPTIDEDESIRIARSVREDNIIITDYVDPVTSEVTASFVNAKRWAVGQTINIGFLGGTEQQQAMVKQYASEWLAYGNVKFAWVDSASAMVRVAITNNASDGSWSYIGTDCLGVKSGQTMTFGWLDGRTIRHEFGHMMGLLHSHLSRNFPYHFIPENVIHDLSGPPNNWNVETINANVLSKYDPTASLTETPWEVNNVMNYHLAKNWLVEGVEVNPSEVIGESEKALIAMMYPQSDVTIKNRAIQVNEVFNGNGTEIAELTIVNGGQYQFRCQPVAPIFVNGNPINTLVRLANGTYHVQVNKRGGYRLVIKRLSN